MKSRFVTAEEAVELITETLQRRYPGVVFAVRLEDPLLSGDDIRGLDVIWIDGPEREEIENLLDRFQGVVWDPKTGELASRSHYQVDEEGDMVEVFFNVDYIFCDGPAKVFYA